MRPAELPNRLSHPQHSGVIRWSAWSLAVGTLLGLGLALRFALAPPWLVAALLICLGGFLSVPLVLARGQSSRTPGLLLLGFAAAAIVVGALAQGRLDTPILVLLTVLPVVGLVLLDSRAAWLIAAGITGLAALLVLLDERSTLFASAPESLSPRWALAACVAATCLLIALVAGLYDRRMAVLSRELRIHATGDHLTGLANRRRLDEVLEEECRRAERRSRSLAIILLDIDNFKSLNDARGHPHGDLCLIAVSYAITTCMRRAGDLAARYGGEEFVALLPETTEAQAIQVAESIREAVRQMKIPHESSAEGILTVSLGVAAGADREQLQPDRLLEEVDKALYRAKQGGRDRTVAAGTEV